MAGFSPKSMAVKMENLNLPRGTFSNGGKNTSAAPSHQDPGAENDRLPPDAHIENTFSQRLCQWM